MSRDMSASMQTGVQESILRPVWIIRLDIDGDPVHAWTGAGDLVVSPGQTGDEALDGYSYTGLANIGKISAIKDTDKGSAAVKLSLPGVDLTDIALKQIVVDSRAWQYRQAWIWFALLDVAHSLVTDPIRIKTGRMDQLSVSGNGAEGAITLVVESHQAHTSRALKSRYSRQKDIDPTDTSQDFIHDLANRKPGLGSEATLGGGGFGGTRTIFGGAYKDLSDTRGVLT